MPSNVKTYRIADVAAPVKNAIVGGPFGSDLVSRDYVPTGIPVIRGANLSYGKYVGGDFVFVTESKAAQLAANLARPGDIVFTQRGNAVLHGGQVAIVPNEPWSTYLVSQSQMKLTPDPERVNTQFLYCVFSSPIFRDYLQSSSIVTGVPHINLQILKDFVFALPSIDEQLRIAELLGALDDKIEQNRRTGAKLEGLARAVFKAWFVDFEPVKAKAAGATAFPGMPSETFDALPTRLVDTALGPVPQGWVVASLSDVADVIMGTSPPSATYNDAGEGYALINGPVEYGERFPLRVKWTTAPVKLAEAGDLIFCVRGSTTGRRVLSDGVYGLGRGVCAIRSKQQAQAFVNQLIENALPQLLAGTTGSVFPSLSAPAIKTFEVIRPNTGAIRAFSDFADPMLHATNAGAAESAKLATLRDYLLPRLLSGRLRVGDGSISHELKEVP